MDGFLDMDGGVIDVEGMLVLWFLNVFCGEVLNYGGGIWVQNGVKLMVSELMIDNNVVDEKGGGIYNLGDMFVFLFMISNNLVMNNVGGGIN